MNLPITGGCYCGAIRYESIARPVAMFKCHCRDCQHLSGGPYTPVVVFLASKFKITKGQPKYNFTERASGGKHRRSFCSDCGSRLTGAESDERAGIIAVVAGSLDDPSIFQPKMDIFIADAQPWDLMDPSLPKFERSAPAK